ncbi:MAG: hypothetical protein R3F40_15370 [Candidatus Competibacteraceae bacterium]
MIVRSPSLETVATWQLPLLEAVARNIAAALRANEQTEHRQPAGAVGRTRGHRP